MRLLSPIVLILFGAVDRDLNQLPMCYAAAKLVRHDLPGLLTILIKRPPEVMLLAIDFYEDLVNAEGITVAFALDLMTLRAVMCQTWGLQSSVGIPQ
ncbi:MAG: hypothetical protein AB8B57_17135 [Congregibacter sp.]